MTDEENLIAALDACDRHIEELRREFKARTAAIAPRLTKPLPRPSKIRRVAMDDNGELDDLVAEGVYVHLERMDEGSWWLKVGPDAEGKEVTVWLQTSRPSRTKITPDVMVEGPE